MHFLFVIDPQAEIFYALKEILNDEYQLEHCTKTCAPGVDDCSVKPDLILINNIGPVPVNFSMYFPPDCTANGGTPVITIIRKQESEYWRSDYGTGIVDYISKPFNPPEVRARIRTHLKLREARIRISSRRAQLSALREGNKSALVKDTAAILNLVTKYVAELGRMKEFICAGSSNSVPESPPIIHPRLSIDPEEIKTIFDVRFDFLNQEFFSRLLFLHPEISGCELKLCALLRLNVPGKETAAITGLSGDELKQARGRIRKKLSLSRGIFLSDYLARI